MIKLGGIYLKICLTKDDYEKIKKKEKFTDKDEPAEWINRCVVGKVSKEELDDQRNEEMNTLDFI